LVLQAVRLVDRCHRISFSSPAPGVGHPGDLLLKSTIGLVATVSGGSVPGVRYLGLMATRRPGMSLGFAGLFLCVLVWEICIRPSHDRPWRPEVSVMPRATIDGDRVRITGFRNFEYRSTDDFTVRYEEREFLISHLTSLDFFVSYWKQGPVGHTFLSFNFDN